MRRAILVAIPTLLVTFIIQTAIISRMVLLSGNADIVLLVVAAWALQERARGAWVWGVGAGFLAILASGVPWYIYMTGYLSVVLLARLLIRRIWQAPLLAMFAITFIGTVEILMLTYVQRTLFVISLPLSEVLLQIVLPSILLNLLMAIPIHAVIKDLSNRVYPAQVAA
jgi:rod shape-determining protein MreD